MCGVRQSMWTEWSTNNSPPLEHLIITPAPGSPFPAPLLTHWYQKTALRLKYFSMFEIYSYVHHILKKNNRRVSKWLIGTLVQTFFPTCPQANNMFVIIIAAFYSANFVYDENNSTFSSVILPTDRCISYRFLLMRNRIQMK